MRFAAEPGETLAISRERGGQNLERDVPIQLGLAGAIALSRRNRHNHGRVAFGYPPDRGSLCVTSVAQAANVLGGKRAYGIGGLVLNAQRSIRRPKAGSVRNASHLASIGNQIRWTSRTLYA